MARQSKKAKYDEIKAQILKEIAFARRYKQGKVTGWRTNEDMYYGKKLTTEESRANVELGQMQSFVHTLLSKVDTPMEFKYIPRKNSQFKRVKQLNALRVYDAKRDFWSMKDLVTKKQAIIYGRAVLFYSASSYKAYEPHLEPCDVYDFLIDPSAGGIDIDKAKYLGRYNIRKSKEDLENGVKDKYYLKEKVRELLDGDGNTQEVTQEDINKRNRDYGLQSTESSTIKDIGNDGVYKFWEWFTTYKGQRYYALITDSGCMIRCELLSELFEANDWPAYTWAAFPDLTEFWTPSYCDYVREVFMAQNVSVNQLLDNAEKRNKPQKVVNVSAIENLASLKYRKDGYIPVTGDVNVNNIFKTVDTPELNTPINVYELLETIHQSSSGVTAGSKGLADGNEKATIYEGNQANVADRFGLLNKSYAFAYERFAQLYENGVREHLKKKVAVEILGPDGLEIKKISKDDIFDDKHDKFGVMTESSDAELALSVLERKTKLNMLQTVTANDKINQHKVLELQMKIAGFSEEEIRQLLQTNAYGSEEMMSEADRDLELLLAGEELKPNGNANTAYMQRIVDYIKDNAEDVNKEQFTNLVNYLQSLKEVVVANMSSELIQQQMQEQMNGGGQSGGQRLSAPKEVMDTTQEEQVINNINNI